MDKNHVINAFAGKNCLEQVNFRGPWEMALLAATATLSNLTLLYLTILTSLPIYLFPVATFKMYPNLVKKNF